MNTIAPIFSTGSGRPGITGVVLTCNGERMLANCLESLSFCSEILVVDSGSADGGLAIARSMGARILCRSWQGFASQFSYAQDQVATPWFFILDQDERVSAELATAIPAAVAAADQAGTPAAFSVDRQSWYFDRFLRHSGWSPDHIPRLFKTGLVSFSQDAHIHYHPKGPLQHLPQGRIIHYPYTGFNHQLAKLNVYADQGAAALAAKGHKGGVLAGLGHGLAKFFRIYILKKGFLDGRAGFLAAVHGGFYTFLKYVRVLSSTWGAPFDHQ